MVLEHEVLRVGPVIWYLASIVVAHDVRGAGAVTSGIVGRAATAVAFLRLRDEAVHLAAVDVGGRVRLAVRAAAIEVFGVVEWIDALAAAGVVDADNELAVRGRKAIGAGIRAEVLIERPVLLHDDDHVLNLVDAV